VNITTGSNGTFTFGTGFSITTNVSTAFLVSGNSAQITYSGSITQTAGALMIQMTNFAPGGNAVFQTGTLAGSGTSTGINLNNVDGTVSFNGTTTLSGTAAVSVNTGSSGTISFGSGATMTNVSGTSFTVTASNPILT